MGVNDSAHISYVPFFELRSSLSSSNLMVVVRKLVLYLIEFESEEEKSLLFVCG